MEQALKNLRPNFIKLKDNENFPVKRIKGNVQVFAGGNLDQQIVMITQIFPLITQKVYYKQILHKQSATYLYLFAEPSDDPTTTETTLNLIYNH